VSRRRSGRQWAWQVWFDEVYEREPIRVWSGPSNNFSPWAADAVQFTSQQHYCIISSLLDKSLHVYYCSVTIYFYYLIYLINLFYISSNFPCTDLNAVYFASLDPVMLRYYIAARLVIFLFLVYYARQLSFMRFFVFQDLQVFRWWLISFGDLQVQNSLECTYDFWVIYCS
jgi:hypothetical protein